MLKKQILKERTFNKKNSNVVENKCYLISPDLKSKKHSQLQKILLKFAQTIIGKKLRYHEVFWYQLIVIEESKKYILLFIFTVKNTIKKIIIKLVLMLKFN